MLILSSSHPELSGVPTNYPGLDGFPGLEFPQHLLMGLAHEHTPMGLAHEHVPMGLAHEKGSWSLTQAK